MVSLFAPVVAAPSRVGAGSGRRVVGAMTLVALTIAAAAVLVEAWRLTLLNGRVRAELEAWLSDRLASDVTVEQLEVSLLPRPWVRAEGITIRIPGRPDLPPFVTVGSWTGAARLSWAGLREFDEVRLTNVRITVPPRRMEDLRSSNRPPSPGAKRPPALAIDRLLADRVMVMVLPRDAGREPHAWDVRDLAMTRFSFDEVTPFDATVDTPLPADRARVTGTVGPWPRGDFDQLPLAGSYALIGALDGVTGLRGKISAQGTALGTLDRLATTGTLVSPGAGLEGARGATLPLEARYDALFDATNANVRLSRVEVRAGEARLEATGEVVRAAGSRARRVSLRLASASPDGAADVLRVMLDPSPVVGRLGFDVAIEVEPSESPMIDRLSLDGTFELDEARFRDRAIQGALDTISARGLGHPDRVVPRVPMRARGEVTFANGRLRLARARLAVPGTAVTGGGTYAVGRDDVDFRGIATLQARLSQTQRGWKRWLLKPFNALFARDGAGTRLVLEVSGPRERLDVDVDLSASLKGAR